MCPFPGAFRFANATVSVKEPGWLRPKLSVRAQFVSDLPASHLPSLFHETGKLETARFCMNKIILINVSGDDRPGLTTSLTRILSGYNVRILDIGQAVVHESLAL